MNPPKACVILQALIMGLTVDISGKTYFMSEKAGRQVLLVDGMDGTLREALMYTEDFILFAEQATEDEMGHIDLAIIKRLLAQAMGVPEDSITMTIEDFREAQRGTHAEDPRVN